jgi:hypothetical protein
MMTSELIGLDFVEHRVWNWPRNMARFGLLAITGEDDWEMQRENEKIDVFLLHHSFLFSKGCLHCRAACEDSQI